MVVAGHLGGFMAGRRRASSIGTVGDAVTAAGIVAGLVGMDLVLVMLLLAARIPLIDATVGHDRALEFHRRLGKPSLYLLLAHGVLVAIGYGMAEGLDPVSESIALWTLVPDMWLAFVSLALFIGIVLTSLVIVRRRFPYEFWYCVHLLTYLAVATSIPHQFSVGGLFAEGTWQRWYWMALCVATGAALIWYRVVTPLRATFRHQLTVHGVVPEAPGVVSIVMDGLHVDRLTGHGGRFFIWRFLAPGLWWHAHPFSMSAEPRPTSPPGVGQIRITVRNLGKGSAALASLKPGTKVAVEGPYGLFSTAARTRRRLVLIGAGIGITPLPALLESTPFTPGDATVILRGGSPDELYLGREIMALCEARGATLYHLTGPRSRRQQATAAKSPTAGGHPGANGTVARDAAGWLPAEAADAGYRLLDYAPDLADADIYICGPSAWTRHVIADAKSSGAKDEQIHNERFDW